MKKITAYFKHFHFIYRFLDIDKFLDISVCWNFPVKRKLSVSGGKCHFFSYFCILWIFCSISQYLYCTCVLISAYESDLRNF